MPQKCWIIMHNCVSSVLWILVDNKIVSSYINICYWLNAYIMLTLLMSDTEVISLASYFTSPWSNFLTLYVELRLRHEGGCKLQQQFFIGWLVTACKNFNWEFWVMASVCHIAASCDYGVTTVLSCVIYLLIFSECSSLNLYLSMPGNVICVCETTVWQIVIRSRQKHASQHSTVLFCNVNMMPQDTAHTHTASSLCTRGNATSKLKNKNKKKQYKVFLTCNT